MMNKVQKGLYEKIVAPSIQRTVGVRLAVIRDVDYLRKRATIAYTDGQRAQGQDIAEVNIVRQNGLHEAGPFEGDEVLIGFLNNNVNYPYIIGTTDTAYADIRRAERDRHEGQGALLSDLYTQRTGEKWNAGN